MFHNIDIVNTLKLRGEYTPDFSTLRNYSNILVFVYDSFKRNRRMNYLLKNGARYLGRGKTHTNNYYMKEGTFPIVFPAETKDREVKGYIKGEVYALPIELVMLLDKEKNNGVDLKRELRSITLLDQWYNTHKGDKNPIVRCWMYIGNPHHWRNRGIGHSVSSYPKDSKHLKFYEYLGP